MFGDLVAIAVDAPTFVAECRDALAESDLEAVLRESRMKARVGEYSWDRTADDHRRGHRRSARCNAAQRRHRRPNLSPSRRAPRRRDRHVVIIDAHLHCSGDERAGDVLRSLDDAGVDVAVLLAPFLSEGFSLDDPDSLVRANEHLAALVRGQRDRLVGFAVVNPR